MMAAYAGTPYRSVAFGDMAAAVSGPVAVADAVKVAGHYLLDPLRSHVSEDWWSNWYDNDAGAAGLIIVVDVQTGSGLNLVPRLQMEDPASLKDVTIWSGAQITGTGVKVYGLFPGVGATFGTARAAIALPRRWRFFMDSTGGTTSDYSVMAMAVGT